MGKKKGSDISFIEYKDLSYQEQLDLQDSWDVYQGDGFKIAQSAADNFAEEYNHLGVKVSKPNVYHGGFWAFDVTYPAWVKETDIVREHLGFEIVVVREKIKQS